MEQRMPLEGGDQIYLPQVKKVGGFVYRELFSNEPFGNRLTVHVCKSCK